MSAWSSLLSPAPTGALGCVPPDEGTPVLKQALALTPGCCSSRSWTFLLTVPPGTQSQTSKWTQALFPGYPES